MERAVNDVHFNIDNRISTQHAVEHRLFDAFLDGGNIFARNDAANDLVFDEHPFATTSWAQIHLHVSILTAAAGLLDQLADTMRIGRDRFAVRDLRFTRIRVHLKLAEHTVPDNFQVQFAHAGDDRLACIFMRVNAECRIFLGEPLQRSRHFFLIQFCLRLDGH